jgi:hypothetical protein
VQLRVPPEGAKFGFELVDVPEHLDDAIGPPIRERAAHDRHVVALDRLVPPRVGGFVGEEHPPTCSERGAHGPPEAVEACGRDVREPVREEDHVIGGIGLPGENVCLDVADPAIAADLLL